MARTNVKKGSKPVEAELVEGSIEGHKRAILEGGLAAAKEELADWRTLALMLEGMLKRAAVVVHGKMPGGDLDRRVDRALGAASLVRGRWSR